MTLSALPKTLALLEAIIAADGQTNVSSLARALSLPVPTAHRHVAALVENGYLVVVDYGRYIAGPRLRALVQKVDEMQIIANTAAPVLHRLAAETHCIVQLGTLENDMVTYRIKTGQGAGDLFTKVGMQLEAYCSGIGKVLLAHLPAPEQTTYLATGPFIALTERTITDPALLKIELDRVAEQGFAIDDEEVVMGLQCMAVPIRNPSGAVLAAISASHAKDGRDGETRLLERLKAAAQEVSLRTG